MEHFRVFIAVTPDETVVDRVEATVNDLRREIVTRDVRWENRTKWHVTLRFLGDVPSSEIPALSSALRTNCSAVQTFTGHVRGLGAFPSLKRPRVLWAGVSSDADEFAALHLRVAEASAPFSPEADDKRFHPHLTIARVRTDQRRVSSDISKAVESAGKTDFGSWGVRNVELWRSVLQSGGSRYELLDSIALTR